MNKIGRKNFILVAIYIGAFSVTALAYVAVALAFSAPYLSNAVKATIIVSPAPVPSQSVVINEVMWMGSFGNAKDEWIELRNMTGDDIDIKNWNIDGAVSGAGGHLEIAGDTGGNDEDKYVIPAHGYFLITRLNFNKSAIKNTPNLVKSSLDLNDNYKKNKPLVLKDKNGLEIDRTPDANSNKWPAGWHGIILHLSMERSKNPKDGADAFNWHTCVDLKGYSTDYWKHDGFNCGTPGAENLSKDKNETDPASMEQKVLNE